jgi:hypothetical protein
MTPCLQATCIISFTVVVLVVLLTTYCLRREERTNGGDSLKLMLTTVVVYCGLIIVLIGNFKSEFMTPFFTLLGGAIGIGSGVGQKKDKET